MQEKPNSQSNVFGSFTRQFFITSPGRPPAAVISRSRSPALALTTPTTWAQGGTGSLVGFWEPSGNAFHWATSAAPLSVQFLSARQSPSAASNSCTVSNASPTTASAQCLVASQRAALIDTN